jgi:hypothetical protein
LAAEPPAGLILEIDIRERLAAKGRGTL